MNYLKKFESFQTHDEIHKICRKYNITNYTINEDGSIDVDYNVNLTNRGLEKLPLKFNHVSGYFDCSKNSLTTLEGAPQSVGGYFNCYDNKLTTLKGAPQSVDGEFGCSSNKLTTLKYAPNSVGGDFYCSYNNLTTLEYAPQSVDGDFYCFHNKLTTLEGAPKSVSGIFICRNNRQLKSLEYLSKNIGSEKVNFKKTPVYEIFKLIDDFSLPMIRNVIDLNVVVDDKINLEMLNAILYDIGKPSVEKVEGYSIYIS